MLIKYADDNNLPLTLTLTLLINSILSNYMVISIIKTKEIVFRRPDPKLCIKPVPISEVQQVTSAKLLRITLCDTSFRCSHRSCAVYSIISLVGLPPISTMDFCVV